MCLPSVAPYLADSQQRAPKKLSKAHVSENARRKVQSHPSASLHVSPHEALIWSLAAPMHATTSCGKPTESRAPVPHSLRPSLSRVFDRLQSRQRTLVAPSASITDTA